MRFDARAAEVDNDWRRLGQRKFSSRVDSISYEGLSCLEDGQMVFKSGLTAIIGANGVGKSAFAAAIAGLFGHSDSANLRAKLGGSKLSAVGAFRDKEFRLSLDSTDASLVSYVQEGDAPPSFGFIDPHFTPRIVELIHEDENFSDLLDGITPSVLAEQELLEISYLVGKSYLQCEIFEIDDYRELEPFPYFRVTHGSRVYASEGMGLGELSLFHHFWLFRRLEADSFMVLEEPETYLSPRSQVALMNVLAKRICKKKIWTVVTTHSPTILRRIKEDDIKLLTQTDGKSFFTRRTSRRQIEDLLGEGMRYRAHALVEDDGARSLLKGILENIAPDLLPELQVVAAGDQTRVINVINALPHLGKGIHFVGVLDGDARASVEFPANSNPWPLCFLPGDEDPDLMLKKMMLSKSARFEFASRLGRDAQDVEVACSSLEGEDYHNWPIEFARVLSSDIFSVRSRLVETWLAEPANRGAAEQLVLQLRAATAEV